MTGVVEERRNDHVRRLDLSRKWFYNKFTKYILFKILSCICIMLLTQKPYTIEHLTLHSLKNKEGAVTRTV